VAEGEAEGSAEMMDIEIPDAHPCEKRARDGAPTVGFVHEKNKAECRVGHPPGAVWWTSRILGRGAAFRHDPTGVKGNGRDGVGMDSAETGTDADCSDDLRGRAKDSRPHTSPEPGERVDHPAREL